MVIMKPGFLGAFQPLLVILGLLSDGYPVHLLEVTLCDLGHRDAYMQLPSKPLCPLVLSWELQQLD